MELSDVRLIVDVAERGSLTRAATARSTTQSALSRQLARIEREWRNRLCGDELIRNKQKSRGARLERRPDH